MRVRWSGRALHDLRSIAAYISKDNPTAARRWVARLRERAQKIIPFPHAGRRVPEYERDDVREVFLGNYRIIYRIFPDLIEILTVFEGHRLLRRPEHVPDEDDD
jgi:toxin ParE1/3/4